MNCVHFVQNAHSPGVTYYCELGVHFLLGNFIGTYLYSNNCCCFEIGSAIITCELLAFVDMEQMLLGKVYMSLSISIKVGN